MGSCGSAWTAWAADWRGRCASGSTPRTRRTRTGAGACAVLCCTSTRPRSAWPPRRRGRTSPGRWRRACRGLSPGCRTSSQGSAPRACAGCGCGGTGAPARPRRRRSAARPPLHARTPGRDPSGQSAWSRGCRTTSGRPSRRPGRSRHSGRSRRAGSSRCCRTPSASGSGTAGPWRRGPPAPGDPEAPSFCTRRLRRRRRAGPEPGRSPQKMPCGRKGTGASPAR
mmetsp:Transcript_51922/g.153065  ORF Transcript_51922/g.153065 Transcript_51922/m.153065 type:complete len:225 (+) Transcript_51922:145-819(+)